MKVLGLALAACLAAASVAQADDAAMIAAARKFAEPAMASACDFETNDDGTPGGENLVYEISYRASWQDQDSPDETLTLVQLHCFSAVYNFTSIFVTKDKDGKWSLLSFAEPALDFDYADEAFARLKAPPKVAGYRSQHEMMNAEYLPETKTITTMAKWRGVGDAWSAGQWTFVEGVFILKRFEVDPTFQPPDGTDFDGEIPESYVVFEAPRK